MSLNIQANVAMPKNQMAFKGKKDKVLKNSSKIFDELFIEESKKAHYRELAKTRPEVFKQIMLNESFHKVMSMSKLELVKELFKDLFKFK